MKVNTFLKYNFLADLYVPRVDPSNDAIVYINKTLDMPVSIVSGRQSTTMFTMIGLEFGSRLVNVRNPRGILLFTVPVGLELQQYDMHVHSCDPVVDVYGNITGYREVLRRPQPQLTDVQELQEGEQLNPNEGPAG